MLPPQAKGAPGPGPRALGRQVEQSLHPKARQALVGIQGHVSRAFPRSGALVVETRLSVSEAIERLYLSGVVEYAQPDFRREAFVTPNDPNFASQWALNNLGQLVGGFGSGTPDADIDAVEAWETSADASQVIVGVVDTGVDYTHPDLTANMWTNPGETRGNGIDDDDNGYVDDVHGVDTFNGTGDPIDTYSHGTHVAGIIGAVGNNGVGISGVAWSTEIMALRFMPDGYGYDSDAIEAIEYVLATKERLGYKRIVLNNSWGGDGYSQALYDAIAAARDAGVLFVASAGNESTNTDRSPAYPADYDLGNIVSVGASDLNDGQTWFSNYGCGTVDLFAPGEFILSTTPGGNYEYYSGTSMASPVVAGAAAIVWSQAASLGWDRIKGAVLNGVDKKTQLAGKSVTQGRANLRVARQPRWRSAPSIFAVSPSAASPGQELTVSGVNFGRAVGTASAFGVELEVTSWSSTEIQVVLPSSVLGTGTIQVTSSATGYSSLSGGCVTSFHGETLVGRTILPHGWHAGVRQGAYVWLIGGYRWDGEASALVERYTPSTGRTVVDSQWAMPVPTTNTSGATVGGLIYVPGGFEPSTATALDVFQIFSPAANAWTLGPSLPAPRIQAATAASGGKIYVFGGFSDVSAPQAESTVLIYDPATGSWSEGSPMPTAVGYAAVVALGNGQIWITGGATTPDFGSQVNIVQVYDSATDSWSTRPGLAAARFGHGAARTSNGKFVALHGADTFGRDDGEMRIGSKWTQSVVGPAALYTPSVTAIGQSVYVINGYDFYTDLSDHVFRFTVP
jgi:subtilisin family serine protease